MPDVVLTLNAGSSSIKFAIFDVREPLPAEPELAGQLDGIGAERGIRFRVKVRGRVVEDTFLTGLGDPNHRFALEHLARWLGNREVRFNIAGVGHRIVHGGATYSAPILLDDDHIRRLRDLVPLAPLHQPHNLAGIEAMREALPGIAQVGCFDTAFHRAQPEIAQIFPLPRRLTERGIRRYGFHGLSYEYIADTLPNHLPLPLANGRVIVAHLGNGASMCAMVGRQCRATTMGFTAMDGLMMGTRPGSLDPGILLCLMNVVGMDANALANLLYKESGLLGVSGISPDMRDLLDSDRPEAREAIELFCYRAAREIGSLIVTMDGLDTLVFTGGIGAYAAPVRASIMRRLGWLGLEFDNASNASNAIHLNTATSRIAALALPTDEEWVIARHAARLVWVHR